MKKYTPSGYVISTIDIKKLGLTSGTQKVFTRDELPDESKNLFDLVFKDGTIPHKPIRLNIYDEDNSGDKVRTIEIWWLGSVYHGQDFNASYEVDLTQSSGKLAITVTIDL